uniref:Uncharacterized protein n=1 Tax=uncultured delta proteobacterium HF0070_07E19 TaxID=710823 RepID=E0XX97_9DELT|nr:hypothetical protein [uncultured delta proteobacterium HF0070_07E19]
MISIIDSVEYIDSCLSKLFSTTKVFEGIPRDLYSCSRPIHLIEDLTAIRIPVWNKEFDRVRLVHWSFGYWQSLALWLIKQLDGRKKTDQVQLGFASATGKCKRFEVILMSFVAGLSGTVDFEDEQKGKSTTRGRILQ